MDPFKNVSIFLLSFGRVLVLRAEELTGLTLRRKDSSLGRLERLHPFETSFAAFDLDSLHLQVSYLEFEIDAFVAI